MKKSLKLVFAIILVAIIVFVCIYFIFRKTFKFEFDDNKGVGIWSSYEEADEFERLNSEGFIISYPSFRNSYSHIGILGYGNQEDNLIVYMDINRQMMGYAMNVSEQYRNYAKLDYTVEVKENETLTVKFFGYGYSDDSEPVPLDKTFVYDIKNVSPENPPKLISE